MLRVKFEKEKRFAGGRRVKLTLLEVSYPPTAERLVRAGSWSFIERLGHVAGYVWYNADDGVWLREQAKAVAELNSRKNVVDTYCESGVLV